MAEKNVRKDRFNWGEGDVKIIMPNGKKFNPKKNNANNTKSTQKKGKK